MVAIQFDLGRLIFHLWPFLQGKRWENGRDKTRVAPYSRDGTWIGGVEGVQMVVLLSPESP